MPRVSEEHRAEMRQRIEQAALRCVGRTGLANVSMADIIHESGLSAGAIYGYYASKDELIMAVATEMINDRFEVLDQLQQQATMPHPAIAIDRLIHTIPDDFSVGVIVQLWGMAPVEPQLTAMTSNWIALFTRHIADYTTAWLRQEGLPAATARARAKRLAPALIGLAQGYFVRSALGGPGQSEDYSKSLRAVADMMTVRA